MHIKLENVRASDPEIAFNPCPTRDADPRTELANHATVAARVERPTHVLSPCHEIEIEVRPPLPFRDTVKSLLGLLRRSRPYPAEAIGNPMYMGIHANVLAALERKNEHEIGRFPADPGKHQQLLHRLWHMTAESAHKDATRRFHMTGFVSVEADWIDEAFDLPDRELDHGTRRVRDLEESS